MRRCIALFLALLFITGLMMPMAMATVAAEPEHEEIQRVSCTRCGNLCYTYCYGDRVFYDQGTHGSCTVTAYKSRGAFQCSSCGVIQQQQGYHECINVHSSCGRGTVHICVMNGGT